MKNDKIYICHAKEDIDIALKAGKLFEKNLFSCCYSWIYTFSDETIINYDKSVYDENGNFICFEETEVPPKCNRAIDYKSDIDSSDICILLYTDTTVHSSSVIEETQFAISRKKSIISLKLSKQDYSASFLFLKKIHYIDGTSSFDEALFKLYENVVAKLQEDDRGLFLSEDEPVELVSAVGRNNFSIFISHSHKDTVLVKEICSYLDKNYFGYFCTSKYDTGIEAGKDYLDEILNYKLKLSALVLLVCTDFSRQSIEVEKEIEEAIKSEIPIIVLDTQSNIGSDKDLLRPFLQDAYVLNASMYKESPEAFYKILAEKLGFTTGHHLQKNSERLCHWLIRATAKDIGQAEKAYAQFALGSGYMYGHYGLPKNKQEALRLLQLAYNNGNTDAAWCLFLLYENGGEEIRKNKKLALKYCLSSAEHGNYQAQLFLGMGYLLKGYKFLDVEKNVELGEKWLRTALTNQDRYNVKDTAPEYWLALHYMMQRKNLREAWLYVTECISYNKIDLLLLWLVSEVMPDCIKTNNGWLSEFAARFYYTEPEETSVSCEQIRENLVLYSSNENISAEEIYKKSESILRSFL